MNPSSEYQHLCALRRQDSLETVDVYKACVSVSNHGMKLPEEEALSSEEKNLLEVRRKIFEKKLEVAEEILRLLNPSNNLLNGDKHFLLGQLFHKQGQQQTACRFMYEAADFYKKVGESHRELRARVNGAICISSLDSTLFGDLFSFEQEARRHNYIDIVANISRTRAIELLIANRPQEAFTQAMEASKCYKMDGYRDDDAVALLIAAISLLVQGDVGRALNIRAEALTSKGKAEVYLQVFEDILQGKTPKIPQGHPLSKVSWKTLVLKAESVPGKIVQRLRERPRKRDELIFEVWGEEATDQAYCSRLYTAINSLRKEKSITVIFDGEYYRLA